MMNQKPTTEATPLGRYQVFHTNDISKIAPATRRISATHQRRILDDGPLSYHLNVAQMDHLQVSWMRCNRDMEIDVPQRCPIYLLHFLEEGVSHYTGPDLAAVNTPGHGAILSPASRLKIRHMAVTAYSLVLPESLLVETLGEILGTTPEKELVFHPHIDLESPVDRAIRGLFDFLIKDLENPNSHIMNSPSFQAEFAKTLASLLINGLAHNHSSMLKQSHPSTGLGRVQMVEKFIGENLGEPLTLDDMARVACVSKRALQKDFRQYRRFSPMTHLLKKRLAAIYQDLLDPTAETTVTDSAHKFGITSLGRFAGRYKKYFGELPSKTLARGKKGQTAL